MLRTRIRAGPVAGLVMSLLFAALLTVVQAGPRLLAGLEPHFGEPGPTTLRLPYAPRIVRDISTGRAGLHYEHERAIVPMGTVRREDVEQHWTAFIYESLHWPSRWPRLAGIFAIMFAL